MMAMAMTMMTSCDEGSSPPFPFPLCPDALSDMQHYSFMLFSAILDTEQCVNPLLGSSGDRLLIKLLSAHCTPAANGEKIKFIQMALKSHFSF